MKLSARLKKSKHLQGQHDQSTHNPHLHGVKKPGESLQRTAMGTLMDQLGKVAASSSMKPDFHGRSVTSKLPSGYKGSVKITSYFSGMNDFVTSNMAVTILNSNDLNKYFSNIQEDAYYTVEPYTEKKELEEKAGNISGLGKHLAKKYGPTDEGFFTRCMAAEELSDYDYESRAAICAKAHKVQIGHWPGEKKKEDNPLGLVLNLTLKGGPGSGNFDHAGRPGKVGGSAPGEGGGESLRSQRDRLRAEADRQRNRAIETGYGSGSLENVGKRMMTTEEANKLKASSKFSGHRQLANTLAYNFYGRSGVDRGSGGFAVRVMKVSNSKYEAVNSWLKDNGFHEYNDMWKNDYFKKDKKGRSWTDGKFRVEVSLGQSALDINVHNIEKGKIKIDYSKVSYYD